MSDSNTTPISSPRRVLVTGAAKGIGVGIARAFAHHGDRILIHFRSDPDAAQRLADELRPHAAEVALHQADLADLDQLDQLFAHVRSLWGGLDVAVNNAGWDPGFVPLDHITPDLYRQLTDINIRGTLFCCLREIELMRQHHLRGAIINIGSVQQNTTVTGRTLYAMSKGAIHSLTAQLALETGPDGIRINNIAPGYIEVPRLTDRPDFSQPHEAAKIPLRRTGTPDDIGQFALFLASDKASFIHGQTLVADGGVSCRLARFTPDLN